MHLSSIPKLSKSRKRKLRSKLKRSIINNSSMEQTDGLSDDATLFLNNSPTTKQNIQNEDFLYEMNGKANSACKIKDNKRKKQENGPISKQKSNVISTTMDRGGKEMINVISDIMNESSDTTKKTKLDTNTSDRLNDTTDNADSEWTCFDPDSTMTKLILNNLKEKKTTVNKKIKQKKSSDGQNVSRRSSILTKFNITSTTEPPKFVYKKSAVELLCNAPENRYDSSSVLIQTEGDSTNTTLSPNELTMETNGCETDTTESELDESLDSSLPVEYHHSFLIEAGYCVALLKAPSRVYVCGKLRASLLHGEVSLLGYELDDRPRDVYSTCTSSLLHFDVREGFGCPSLLRDKLIGLGLSPLSIELIMEKAPQGPCAVLMLRPLKNRTSDFVERHLPECALFAKNKENLSETEREAFKLLQCTFYDGEISERGGDESMSLDDLSKLLVAPDRNNLSDRVTMICGGKNAGKSTALRHLANKCLRHGPALVLDLDPGQPEFTVCGVLSVAVVQNPLLGPNFTHLLEPKRSLCLGLISVSQNEARYLNCVRDLMEYCRKNEEFKSLPWIVNTMGYTGSLGLKLLTEIIHICQPDIVIEIFSSNANNNFEMPLSYERVKNYLEINTGLHFERNAYEYYSLQPYQSLLPKGGEFALPRHIEAKTERLLNVLAYFSQMPTERSCSVLSVTPYVVSSSKIRLLFNNLSVDESFVPKVLNGRIVALCHDKNAEEDQSSSEGLKVSNYGTSPIVCYGFGLIRGIDVDSGLFYILTPLHLDRLSTVNALVYGESFPECGGVLSVPNLHPRHDSHNEGFIPYTTSLEKGTEQVAKHRHLHQIPKRKFNPLRLMEMARKAKKQ